MLFPGSRLPARFQRVDIAWAAGDCGRPDMDIRVKVIPKSSKTELTGYLPDGTWKVKVAAAPERGKANRALCDFMAEKLGVAKSKIRIVSGETSHLKRIHVDD
jgi:uncharacterized protein (TIGR00251 family)